MKSIMFTNRKGGVGKSAVACQFAHYLADKLKKRVLFIDLDAQANSTYTLGLVDGLHLGVVGLHGEHQTAAYGFTVEQHRAGAAGTVLATQVGAGQATLLTHEIRQGHPRFDDRLDRATIDRHLDR